MNLTPVRSLTVFGRFMLRVGDREVTGLPRKAQALFAYLALQPDRQVPREILADLLWTRSGPQQGRQSLRQMLVVLRRSPAGDLVGSDANALWIEPGTVAVDALALQAGLTATDQAALSDCAALYRGDLLEDLPAVSPGFDEWLLPQRARFAGVMAQTLRRLAAARLAVGEFDAAAEAAARLVAMDTLDEAAHRLAMDCLARAGRRAEALQQFETCVRILQAELDIAPEAETVALAERIRAGPAPPKILVEPRHSDDAQAAAAPTPTQADATPPIAATGVAAAAGIAVQPGGAAAMPARWHHLRGSVAWGALVLCIVAISLGMLALRQPPMPPPGILVAGFHNISGIPAQDIAIAGFSDLLKARLVMHRLRLSEVPSDATETAAAGRDPIRQATRARYLLQGSAALDTKLVRVTARLTDLRQGTELWSRNYEEPVFEASQIADDIAAGAALAVAQDRDIVAAPPNPLFAASPRTARELVALGHQMDYFTANTSPETQNIYRLALQFDSNDEDALVHLARTYINAALASSPLDQVALADADASLGHALRLDPANIFALYNTCLLRRVQNRIPEAIELCKRALDIDPRNATTLHELGHDLLEAGDAARAITSYQAAIDAAPYSTFVFNVYKGLGVASLALGHHADAVGYLEKSVELDDRSDDDEGLWLAAILEMDGRHTEAAKLIGTFAGKHPGLRIDDDYLRLLRAPAYADCRHQVLAALASAGYPN